MGTQKGKQGFWTYYLAGLFIRMCDNHHFLFAAGLAFATLFTLVPLAFLVFFVLGSFLDPASMTRLVDMTVEVIIPYQNEAAYMKEVLYSRIPEVVEFKEAYGVSGLSILIFTASGLFSSMRTLLNTVFKASGEEHKLAEKLFWQWPAVVKKLREQGRGDSSFRPSIMVMALLSAVGKLKDFALLLLVLFAFLLSVLLLPGLSTIVSVLVPLGSSTSYFYGLVTIILVFSVFLGLYWLVPQEQPGIKVLARGALCASLLWKLSEWLFGYYLGNFGTLGYLYGAYFLSVAVGIWLYFTAIVFIVGAEVAQLCQERRGEGF